MNDLELKQLWQQQVLTPPTKVPDEQLIAAMKKKMTQFGRTLFWRDVREVAACLILIVLFLPDFFRFNQWLAKAGCLVVVVTAIYIGIRLVAAQRIGDRKSAGDTLRGYLLMERQKLDRQIHLLRTVLWWYILPLYVGAVMVVFGIGGGLVHKVGFAVFYALVCAWIWWLNQQSVKKHLMPLRAEVEERLNELPEEP
jgi:hypothetical protein